MLVIPAGTVHVDVVAVFKVTTVCANGAEKIPHIKISVAKTCFTLPAIENFILCSFNLFPELQEVDAVNNFLISNV
jgi:hypothetical protein